MFWLVDNFKIKYTKPDEHKNKIFDGIEIKIYVGLKSSVLSLK